MKKLLLLIAFFAMPIVGSAHSPQLIQREAMDVNKASVTTREANSLFDMMKLESPKSGPSLQGFDREAILNNVNNGQFYEMGIARNYNFTYEPYSQTFWFVTSQISLDTADSKYAIKSVYVVYCKYIPDSNDIVQESISETKLIEQRELWGGLSGTPTTVETHWWNEPTVVVMNPTHSTNVDDVTVVVECTYEICPSGQTRANEFHKYFAFTTGARIAAGEEALGFYENEVQTNTTSNYYLQDIMKGIGANINGKPYALFWTNAVHSSYMLNNNETMPKKYAFVSLDLSTMPAVGDEPSVEDKMEILPNSILTGIFNNDILTPANDLMADMSVDYDNNGNIYLAFNNPIGARYADPDAGEGIKAIKTPLVIKAPYGSSPELIQGTPQIDSLPASVVESWLATRGGVVDWEGSGQGWWFSFYSNGEDGTIDLPFSVISEDVYSFVLPILYKSEESYVRELVEVSSDHGSWKIRPIQPTMGEDYFSSYYINTLDNSQGIYAGLCTFEDTTYGGVNNAIRIKSYYGVQNSAIQIAKTADGEYFVAKWQHIDPKSSADYRVTPNPINMYLFSAADNSLLYHFITDTIYKSTIMMSSRKIGEDTWSTPVRSFTIDTISANHTLMPKIVPHVDRVPITYRWSGISASNPSPGQMRTDIPRFIQRNWTGYSYASMIVASARTGVIGIEEGNEATVTMLENAYPNPATGQINFRFSLVKPNFTTLTVTNVFGQIVATAVSQYCNANEYSLKFDTQSLPNGTYYYTLTSGEVHETKMFNVVR